jgi:hypothetical protein
METYIYLVTNCYNDSNKVYICKTTGCRKSNHKKTYGLQITYDYIDKVDGLNRKDWEPIESYWIEQFRQWGFEVMNKNKGGGGPEFRDEVFKEKMRKPFTEEHKQLLRKPKSFMPLKGPKSIETKQKIGLSNSKPKPNGFGEKLSMKKKGKISYKKDIGKSIIQTDLNDKYIATWDSVMDASKYLNKKTTLIYACCVGDSKTAYGYKWKYCPN